MLRAGVPAGVAALQAAPLAWLWRRPGQLVRQLEQRVRRARDHVLGQLGDPGAACPRRLAQQVERLAGAEAVPLGEHADRLLDPDPCGQRVLKLGDGDREPRRFVGFAWLL
jgi:hypothetical protein